MFQSLCRTCFKYCHYCWSCTARVRSQSRTLLCIRVCWRPCCGRGWATYIHWSDCCARTYTSVPRRRCRMCSKWYVRLIGLPVLGKFLDKINNVSDYKFTFLYASFVCLFEFLLVVVVFQIWILNLKNLRKGFEFVILSSWTKKSNLVAYLVQFPTICVLFWLQVLYNLRKFWKIFIFL